MIFKGNKILIKKDSPHIIEKEIKSNGQEFVPIRSLLTHLPPNDMEHILEGFLEYNFRSRSRFCGYCGGETFFNSSENSLDCSKCNEKFFPPVFPAIIVSVIKDGKILLAHNKNFPGNMHSVLAGFVDQGESLEECVKREVYEEVGIKVKNIKYITSQFWSFSTSLMIGFTAEYDSGSITPDGIEIESARWFKGDELPEIPPKISLARTLIDKYLKENNFL